MPATSVVILQGVNAYAGGAIVEAGALALEPGSSLSFVSLVDDSGLSVIFDAESFSVNSTEGVSLPDSSSLSLLSRLDLQRGEELR